MTEGLFQTGVLVLMVVLMDAVFITTSREDWKTMRQFQKMGFAAKEWRNLIIWKIVAAIIITGGAVVAFAYKHCYG